ncbi:MAG TPA: oligosaccharide flippase family protein [Candidatus Acidoferrum sp.]|nr:oligosaccharide flippase family protein [Candidatus Acidoferrum sp.]
MMLSTTITASEDEVSGSPSTDPKKMRSQLLGGSLMLLAGSGLAGVANLFYNVATARMLGPAGFAHATSVYTMLLMMSALTLSYQAVCAKYIAGTELADERRSIFASLHQRAWMAGLGIGLLILLFESSITSYLNLPDPKLVYLLALGTAFYIPLGVRRGYIQGVHAFGPLAINFVLEGAFRLGGGIVLIDLGMGVEGAVLASVLAVIISYFSALPSPGLTSFRLTGIADSFHEHLQTIVFFSGQNIINNFDIVLVKHFFSSNEAGLYAAVALVGRLMNMCAWSVVNTMYPVSARTKGDERKGRSVLFASLTLVFLIVTVLTLGLWAVPGFVLRTLFGAHFDLGANQGSLHGLLVLYAVATGIYSLSSVMITYEMSRKIANTSWYQLAFSGVLTMGIYLIHETLHQVILVRLILLLGLLVILALPLLVPRINPAERAGGGDRAIRLIRNLSEDEVVAEFLRNEFHYPEFDEYRGDFERIVRQPDLNHAKENELRQALLFLRRGNMWRELPANTQWFAVELGAGDLARVRFFPRAQWRRAARGSFFVPQVVDRIRTESRTSCDREFFVKLRHLRDAAHDGSINPSVLLIGVDPTSPLTILDGNHRVAAAMLADPSGSLRGFRFICGFSPEMTRCCWYRTNVTTLFRYFRNRVRHYSYDPGSIIDQFQQNGANAA